MSKKNEEKCCISMIGVCIIIVSWCNGVIFGCLIGMTEGMQHYDNYDEDINYGFNNGVWCGMQI